MKDLSKELLAHSFSQLSYEVKKINPRTKKKYEFNRFNNDYDVWKKPFIKVGNTYFSPIAFFANNDWVYSAAPIAIKHVNCEKYSKKLKRKIACFPEIRKETATAMEKYLADKFLNKGFKVKHIEDKEANKVDGDVDIIVEDKDTTLFIQLKRTYLRTDLKSAYYEYINSDKKASIQLNKATKYFENKNDIFNSKHKAIKWIVSTSYEHINTKIEDCNKINYFDLLFALKRTELKSLEDIVYYLESNGNLLDFYTSSEGDDELLQQLGLPLELVEPNKYRQVVFATEHYNLEYNQLYNKALSFYKKDDKKAIRLFNKCMYYNSNDVELYGALGNCYANIKDLPNLKKAFDKALEIVPNEPYIKRNYALALIENEECFEGIKKLAELYKDYPFVGDLAVNFMSNYNHYKDKLKDRECNIIVNCLLPR